MLFPNKTTLLIETFLLLLLSAACAPMVKHPTPITAAEVQTPTLQPYRIQVGDTLEVKFFYNFELNEQAIVRPDGYISLQLIHEIKVAGMTPGELNDLLATRYAAVLAQAEVTVMVRSIAVNKVYVDGEVNAPGAKDVLGPVTLRQSIALAGGLKDTARADEIIIIRRQESGKPVVLTVDLKKINSGEDTALDISLAAADIVYVPRSHIANVDVWVDQYMRKLIFVPPIPITGF